MSKKKKKKPTVTDQNSIKSNDIDETSMKVLSEQSPLKQNPFAEALQSFSRSSSLPKTLPPPAPQTSKKVKTPIPPMGKRAKKQNAEDQQILNQAYQGAMPLRRNATHQRMVSNKRAPGISPTTSQPGSYRFSLKRDDTGVLQGIRFGKPQQLLEQTASANQFPTAKIDLHGLLQEEARKEVLRFLRQKQQTGHELVLVIFGKGLHSQGAPVLGDMLVDLITEGHAAPFVLAFASAPAREGGQGAMRVRLV